MSTFEWTLHPQAEALTDRLVTDAIAKSPVLAGFSARLAGQTSTRLQDWLDSVAGPVTVDELVGVGYRYADGLWRHPGAQLPAVIPAERYELVIRVDDVEAFAARWPSQPVEGSP